MGGDELATEAGGGFVKLKDAGWIISCHTMIDEEGGGSQTVV